MEITFNLKDLDMRYCLLLFFALISSFSGWSQVRLTLNWNANAARYEVFALSQTTQKNFPIGKARIGVVTPDSAPDSKLNVSSSAAGNWSDSKFITKPASAPTNDFHAVESNGGVVQLQANVPLLLFSFTFSDMQCREGVRLYNNGADPAAGAAGLNGLDFSTTLLGAGNVQVYHSNFSNAGTVCMDCPVEFTVPKLKKQS
jgi:hypothetical protein